ncbi:MAG: type II CAAX endopeptidase family protein [Erysipelotrichaceae bacterium]|nr:type II CAAX endopeptidase family protein [Erysipelotrichaceae bacterium]
MPNKKEKIISKKYAKRSFASVGLVLIIYSLLVLILPIVLDYQLELTNSNILTDPLLYYGIYFVDIVLGSFIPFFLLKALTKVENKKIFRAAKITFSDLLIQTVVFFAVCMCLIYASSMILNTFGYEGRLLSSIGLNFDASNLSYHLYVFMLIVVTPFIEEYVFRGVLLSSLGRFGKRFALIASAVFFALAHNTIGEILPAFAMGILLGKITLRYKSIQPSIIIHILFNGFLYLLCILPSKVATYMTYGIAIISVLAAYLVLTKRYKKITVQKLRSNELTNVLFYSRPTVIISIILMIVHIVMMYLINFNIIF